MGDFTMSFNSWLQNLRPAGAPGRGQRNRRRRGSHRASTHRPNIEALEVRCLLSFSPAANYPTGSEHSAIVSADFNGGGTDIAVVNNSNSSVSVLLGVGHGAFGAPTEFATGPNPRSLVVGDVSGDGKIDLATADDFGVSILRGDGAGGFALPDNISLPGQFPSGYTGTYPVDQSPQSLATGDFNGDGFLDLVVTGGTSFRQKGGTSYYGDYYYYQVDNTYVNVLLSNGSGGFNSAVTRPLNTLSANSLAVGRFNADARDDLAIVNIDLLSVNVLLSDGFGGFSSSYYITTGSPWSVAAADLNGDSKTDLVVANRFGNDVSVLLGDGLGGFGFQSFAVGTGPTSVVLGDFNHDTKLDIATANFTSNDVSVLPGRGNGTFSAAVNSAAVPGGYSIAGGDFNVDGWLDAATGNITGNYVSVLINDQSWPPPSPPSVSINDVTVTEGNAGSASATFTLTLSAASGVDVTVHYATANGSATAGSDYTAASGNLTIPAGQISRTLTVAVTGDRLAEPTESFAVNLSAPSNAIIADSQGNGTILDDEPRISINDRTVTEGNTGTVNASFTVSVSVAYDLAVTVHYQTANGSATAGSDYAAASGDVIIAAGQTSKAFTVAVIGDRSAEPTEIFVVNLIAASNGLFVDSQGAGTILDNEPRISISDVSKTEGKTGQTTLFTFTVTLSVAYDQAVTMSFQTSNGTATTSDSDYIAKSGTLTFAPGETTKTITIEGKGDSKKEAHETFYLDLFGNSSNSLFTKKRGIGTILNDD
jgi:hypothetical protein